MFINSEIAVDSGSVKVWDNMPSTNEPHAYVCNIGESEAFLSFGDEPAEYGCGLIIRPGETLYLEPAFACRRMHAVCEDMDSYSENTNLSFVRGF